MTSGRRCLLSTSIQVCLIWLQVKRETLSAHSQPLSVKLKVQTDLRLLDMFALMFLLLVPLLSALNQTAPPLMRRVPRRETPTRPPSYLRLPMFVDSKQPLVKKERFSPVRGTGQEPLPEAVRGVLLPAQPDPAPPSESADSVKTLCKAARMQVQVERSILGAGDPLSQLRLGTCAASKSTRDHVYFDYDLDRCGTKRKVSFSLLFRVWIGGV